MQNFWHQSSHLSCWVLPGASVYPNVFLCYVLLIVPLILVQTANAAASSQKAGTIKVGTLLATESRIGREALRALQLAAQNINNDTTTLNGTVLELVLANSNCSAFQGAAAAIELFGEDVVAIAGPQTSAASRFVAEIAAASQIPLVSFSATDPSLSEDYYSYFVRLAHSDKLQMNAIADIIHYFGWREVVALYSKDLGLDGIDALDDPLSGIGVRIIQKEGLDPDIDSSGIITRLVQLTQQGSRIIIVHMPASLSRRFFIEAYNMGMMDTGFVWIVTEATASVLDMIFLDDEFVRSVQGVIGICSDIPESPQLQIFKNQWKQSVLSETNTTTLAPISSYGLFAYDSLWTIAKALDNFLNQDLNITFLPSRRFAGDAGGQTDLAKLKLFQNGSNLLKNILGANFTGITGQIHFDNRGDLMGSALKIVNMVGKDAREVGYWNKTIGLFSASPSHKEQGTPTVLKINNTQALQDIIWPGGSIQVPRGWIFPRTGKHLVIGVPKKRGYKEFVGVTQVAENITVTGFCIDVFVAACQLLPYSIDYTFEPYGTDATPRYDDLVQKIVTKDYDGVVGDIAITAHRTEIVDFTQPYATAGLVVLVPTKQSPSNNAWAFMQPFTRTMWLTTLAFFLFSGVVVWILEHKKNDDFRGRPKKQVVIMLWFIFSTLFFAQREEVKSTLGRVALIIWLFVVLIINSSYTASLTSNLTVQQLLPTIQNIGGLLASDVRIGYQTGSFVKDYLIQLGAAESRLYNLTSPQDYYVAMNMGKVGAIVDELPYVQLFLSEHCDFVIAGQEFTKGGWGFAFPKGSQLAIDLSAAILKLSESGKLQRIHDYWLGNTNCSSLAVDTNFNKLGLGTFWGLFVITGVTSVLCCTWYYARMLRRFIRTPQTRPASWDSMPRISRGASLLRSFFSFVEQKEEPRIRSGSSIAAASSRDRSIGFSSNASSSMGRPDQEGSIAQGLQLNQCNSSSF
ncbi:hypothetical protein O6H91_17G064900 [Diphasiastrum complanatum]|uniref:Uncharacterized protein n=4 Tax=Diphasiastrum complanatum TaxID=34168 RepID=A0ACC2B7L6_DIPCM|nr:hypothetical protein O6H91_17G064900 [Diphasiastrum complanatum]KAJ7525761.1 hypothetical protein O6H91_17G064900 [Diphasiastrum complanatum]KAJ7525762.1 hypothetical protein O6H91_17G064900 [Diphasiastrum complanatum]KAJ7525763.1 hypothetical protein O6H91_17G064900 [Diphasiastrum complanatum]